MLLLSKILLRTNQFHNITHDILAGNLHVCLLSKNIVLSANFAVHHLHEIDPCTLVVT